jgi:hypothetical protein
MRLWQSGFMHPVSTGNYGGSNPPGRAIARSFNGRTLDFGPNYECSIHSLAAKFWCGVIQRQDGLLIRAPPGFDSQRRNHASFAFEAHEDEQAALNRQAVSSILTGRTNFPNRDRQGVGPRFRDCG